MEEENNIIKLYKNKIKRKVLLIVSIIFVILNLIIIFGAEPGPNADVTDKIYIVVFFSIFIVIFLREFLISNQANKNALFIKENGRIFQGQVLHVEKMYISKSNGRSKTITKLLVEFFNGKENKIILSNNFPYYIKTEDVRLSDFITQGINMNENIIEHFQYYENGYITLCTNEENNKKVYKYKGLKNKNYYGNLTCKVYEYEGKYVVDDFEGYEKYKINKKERKVLAIVLFIQIILFTIIAITMLALNKKSVEKLYESFVKKGEVTTQEEIKENELNEEKETFISANENEEKENLLEETETIINEEVKESEGNENNQLHEDENNSFEEIESNQIEETEIEYIQGLEVAGYMEIPKFNINAPIFRYVTLQTLNISLGVAYGNLNEEGNTTIFGHGYKDYPFEKLSQLDNSDIIIVTDSNKRKITYEVYDKQIINSNDASYMIRNTNGLREITMQTGNTDTTKLIILAREISM